MGRELFVYWRTPRPASADARAAMRAWQQSAAQRVPDLQARLLQRTDDSGEIVTLMETYALPGTPAGIDAALQRRLVEDGNEVSAPWREGARHVEVFEDP